MMKMKLMNCEILALHMYNVRLNSTYNLPKILKSEEARLSIYGKAAEECCSSAVARRSKSLSDQRSLHQ